MAVLEFLGGIVWGPVGIVLLVGSGIFMTFRARFIQVRRFFYSFELISGKFDSKEATGEVTHFQALSAALSATIGTGNIAGVATAITLGGPGAVFWMWVTAVFGMALKYAEALLSLRFREVGPDGVISAGPMYYIERGIGQKWLACLFALFAVIASFGIGNMVQANSVAEPALHSFGIPKLVTGVVIGILVFLVIVGGIKRIGKVASLLVPAMCVIYIVGALAVILMHLGALGPAFREIFGHAFSASAASGGFAGAAVAQAIRFGVARGVFSNEAGLGSAPIAHGAAQTEEPVREGVVAMIGPFVDTLVICTMTALVIIMTGAHTLMGPGGTGLTGAVLTSKAFQVGIGVGRLGEYIVAVGIILFAVSTVISWSYYGDRSIEYLLGRKAVLPYRIFYCLLIPVGAVKEIGFVWTFSDVANGFMAWPNLVAILLLSPVVVRMTRDYFSDSRRVRPMLLEEEG
nr:sodium:alanine symporter family protein [uncultured Holophaga sp.]